MVSRAHESAPEEIVSAVNSGAVTAVAATAHTQVTFTHTVTTFEWPLIC